jgi:hypothetical protein
MMDFKMQRPSDASRRRWSRSTLTRPPISPPLWTVSAGQGRHAALALERSFQVLRADLLQTRAAEPKACRACAPSSTEATRDGDQEVPHPLVTQS